MKKSRTLRAIQAPIQTELDAFEKQFKQIMSSKVHLLDLVTTYVLRRKGKRIRPTLVFLCAGVHGTIGVRTHRGAALIELLHTATLMHDDVVDNASKRRGLFSINAVWKNKIAVLVGDYLYSQGLLLALKHEDYPLLQHVAEAVKAMSEGELLQLQKARKLDITEEVYIQIIQKKTASLFATCCSVGAVSVGASPEVQEQMHAFGQHLGIAFQIRDDLFDYESPKFIGKPLGTDIKEKKLTMPLIYALSQASSSERKRMLSLVKNHSEEASEQKKLIAFVRAAGGLEYSAKMIQKHCDEATTYLHHIPDSTCKEALKALVAFTVERKS